MAQSPNGTASSPRSTRWIPDIVVGVDFGMTCTGVAYSVGPRWDRPETLTHWPGRTISQIDYKAPTLVGYDHGNSAIPRACGFEVDVEDETLDVREFFKLDLDPRFGHDLPDRYPMNEVYKWFQDYMTFVYRSIISALSKEQPRWKGCKIDFMFSVPTTWKDPAMIVRIEQLLRQAGFGRDGEYHNVEITLTEAEAAAVYACKHQYQQGDIMMICDAGGGTTDVNILKLLSNPGEPARIQQLGYVEDASIGSTQINIGFKKLMAGRLERIQDHLPLPPERLAERMTHGRFEEFKCSFGGGGTLEMPVLPIKVPGLPDGFSDPELGIEDSKMILSREELKELFDRQVDRMFSLIDQELFKHQQKHPSDKVRFLVMSGGFGSSPYIQTRLRSQYGEKDDTSGTRMIINAVRDPQLAVVHGLVLKRTQAIQYQQEVFAERCCRASYGVLIKEIYDPQVHLSEDTKKDPHDNKVWAINQIDWLIKQGHPIFDSAIKKSYRMKLQQGREGDPWKAAIVMCDLPADRLPRSTKSGEAAVICSVKTLLSPDDMKLKNRHWWNLGRKYQRADFAVKMLLGVIDLKFQILGKDGETCSREHDDIAVDWGAPVHEESAETESVPWMEKT